MMKQAVMTRFRLCRWAFFGLLGLAALAMPLAAFSQNCALCYTQAASAGARMIQALKSGILILVIPPTLASVGMIFVMRHKDTQVRHSSEADEWSQDW
ncbi:MAG TPA: hypothetical protein VMB18_13320 [Terriglobales bacterium]|nr:hypothetical protein [Terriglobales bacterium]